MGERLTGDQITLFFLQLGVLLVSARLLGELMKRLGQPAVLGELLAGILLGPSLLGWAAPVASEMLFPAKIAWAPLLETISWFGLVLLMLLTGLETDVRLLRSLGKPAFMASLFGLLVPFGSGIGLGALLPERYFPSGELRLATTLFFATALSVSAMPVIAKILMDLKLVKRNIGVITLTAAVVDDTVGWILLAVIAGIATGGGFQGAPLARTLGFLLLFLVLARYVIYPLVRWALRVGDQASALPGAEYVVIVVLTFLCAAATEAIGVHAVFGAFVAGTILRQCPTLSPENLHRLEVIAMTVFAPVFFAFVGLKVDFTKVQDLRWPAVVVGVAVGGKVLGCLAGGLLGRTSFIEALVLGLGMSARGAMGLVVAVVGLSLGVVGQELFSVIVLMAMVTSVLAPLTVKPLVRFLPVTAEEREREKEVEPGFVPQGRAKMLIPVAGGSNALLGCHLAATICRTEGDGATALYIERSRGGGWRTLLFWRRRYSLDVEGFFKRIESIGRASGGKLALLKVGAEGGVQATILAEVKKGYPFLVLGASGQSHPVYDPFITGIVRANPCHVVIVRGIEGRDLSRPIRRVLVPTDGSYLGDAAFQFAVAYAVPAKAKVVLFHVVSAEERNPLLPVTEAEREETYVQESLAESLRAQFSGKIAPELLECKVREGRSLASALREEIAEGEYDLAILGAENKSIVDRVYFGRNVELVLDELWCPVAIVVPRVGGR